MMPIRTYMGRMSFRSVGSCNANKAAPQMQMAPPIMRVWGAPIRLAVAPAIRLPKGATPWKAIE